VTAVLNEAFDPAPVVVVPNLSVGGAERHVITLLPQLDKAKFTPSVICIGEEGALFPALKLAGVDARALHLDGTAAWAKRCENWSRSCGGVVPTWW